MQTYGIGRWHRGNTYAGDSTVWNGMILPLDTYSTDFIRRFTSYMKVGLLPQVKTRGCSPAVFAVFACRLNPHHPRTSTASSCLSRSKYTLRTTLVFSDFPRGLAIDTILPTPVCNIVPMQLTIVGPLKWLPACNEYTASLHWDQLATVATVKLLCS